MFAGDCGLAECTGLTGSLGGMFNGLCKVPRRPDHQGKCHAGSQEHYAILLKHRASEYAACECAGIQVYSIVVYLRLAYRRMAVNHNLSEAFLVAKKIVPYPEQIFGALVGKIDAGSHARVYEEIIPQSEAERQRDQKSMVVSR